MNNWKVIAIIAATAVATAAAVVFLLQKQNSKRKMRFDSSEFEEDELMDDIIAGDPFSFAEDDLDVDIYDSAAEEDAADTEEAAEDEAADADDAAEGEDA